MAGATRIDPAFATALARSVGTPTPLRAPVVVATPTPRTPVLAAPVAVDPHNRVFDSTRAAFETAHTNTARFLDQGEYSRAAGASLGQLVTVPAGVINDLINKPGNALLAAGGRVIGGALGSDGSTKVNKAPAKTAATATKSATVADALDQGRTAGSYVTPQDVLGATLLNAFNRKLSINQIAALTPSVAAAARVPVSNKDALVGTVSNVADSVYKAQLATAAQMAPGKDRDEAYSKATDAYFAHLAAPLGVDPTKLGFANQLEAQ